MHHIIHNPQAFGFHQLPGNQTLEKCNLRKCRFDTWEEAAFRPGKLTSPMTWDEASSKFGENNIRRAFTYKALNKLYVTNVRELYAVN